MSAPSSEPFPETRFDRIWRIGWALFFMVPGLGLCLFALGFDGYRQWLAAEVRGWRVVTGRIDRHGYREVGHCPEPNPRRRRCAPEVRITQYEPRLEYSYVVDGRRYRNDRIWQSGPSWRFGSRAQVDWWVEHELHPNALEVHYDPDDPARSALFIFSGVNPGFWASLVTVPVGLGFAWAGWGILRDGRPRRDKRVTKEGGATTSPP